MGLLNAELDTGGVYIPAMQASNQIQAGRLANERAGLLNRYMQEDRPYQVQSLKDAADKSARENRIGAASEESEILAARKLAERLRNGDEDAVYQAGLVLDMQKMVLPFLERAQTPQEWNNVYDTFVNGKIPDFVRGDTPEENAQFWSMNIPQFNGNSQKEFDDFKTGVLNRGLKIEDELSRDFETFMTGVRKERDTNTAEIERKYSLQNEKDLKDAGLGRYYDKPGGRGLSTDDPGYDRIMRRVTDDITASFYDDQGEPRFTIGMPTAYEEQQLKRKLTESESFGVTLNPTQALDQMRGYVNGEGEFARGMAEGVITPQMAKEYIASGIWTEDDVNPALDAYMEMAKKSKPDARKTAGELVDAFRDAVKDGKKAKEENINARKEQEARTSYEKEHGPGSYQKQFFDRRRQSLKNPENSTWWGP